MEPLRNPEIIPFSPRASARTASESVTIEKIKSDPVASCRGESAHSIPSLKSGSAFSLVRFHPVTVWPAAISRGTIACPISPSPINPTFTAHLHFAAYRQNYSLVWWHPSRRRAASVFQVLIKIVHEDVERLLLDLVWLERAVLLIEHEDVAMHGMIEASTLH